jgi:hypothetical protein
METPSGIFYSLATESHRWSGAKNDVTAPPDPISMSMSVEDYNSGGMRHDFSQNIRSVHQCQADAIA